MSDVYGTLLAGMEAEILTKTQLHKMETLVTRLARRAWGTRASYMGADGARKYKDNMQLKEQTGMATIKSELQHRRAQWWRNMIKDTDSHKQIRAATMGKQSSKQRKRETSRQSIRG